MKTINLKFNSNHFLADQYTPIGVYTALRDKFRSCSLYESLVHKGDNGRYSHIVFEPKVDFVLFNSGELLIKSKSDEKRIKISSPKDLENSFEELKKSITIDEKKVFTGFYGHTNFEAVKHFDSFTFEDQEGNNRLPLINYSLHKFRIDFDHHNNTIEVSEILEEGEESELDKIKSILHNHKLTHCPFQKSGDKKSNLSDEEYKAMVVKAKQECQRGNVFQLVLSRQFSQNFTGDDFNIYRALRSINPSPYMYYCDFGNYKIFGSSPEAQLVVKNGKAILNPIAGTAAKGEKSKTELLENIKENAEHVMLVDLARNDLSKVGRNTKLTKFRSIESYSHVDHMVSEVETEVTENQSRFKMFADTFPAGTLSGAPKFKAIQLINEIENTNRNIYGGAIGYFGLDNTINQAITIRSFLSQNNTLFYQAGAGIVIDSTEEGELEEINNKLFALNKALESAETL